MRRPWGILVRPGGAKGRLPSGRGPSADEGLPEGVTMAGYDARLGSELHELAGHEGLVRGRCRRGGHHGR